MQEWKKRTTAVIVLVAFSVFVTFAVLWLSMGSRAKLFRTVALSWCTEDSCLEHAARLTESMDRTVQPCQDFYAYVCGKWKPNADETYISDVAGRMRASLLRANSIILYNGSSRQSSFKKVSATFKSCIERKSEDQASNIKKLKKFMFARGIPWPQDPPEDRHPLDVLLDLDINWGIPVLFKTRLLRNPLVAVVACKEACSDSHGLEASFAAYKASLSISESRALSIFDSPVKAGKVFFLSLVRGTCGTSGEHINAMLKKFPPFAKIYGCAATGKSRR
ncbi:hypothetical protein IscW_ISCW019578 [Ixodes scapularis]|uniref:Peptidase M13 N-terminal domain-containing protein n=1 Tax=Ixodes scapularis TaxID=6945 RepID=B7PU02_IXOSC|nr:hypothetical protein IscW_ISCW019578 [Ixodes scapularis]|eukprot:XP_002405196.1 hypothetical protein IscW_ISCW019578 [Ixodes scapularis]